MQENGFFPTRFAINRSENPHERSGEADGSDDTEERQGHA